MNRVWLRVQNIWDAFVGALIALAIVTPIVLYSGLLDTKPYTDVELIEFRVFDEHVDLIASFEKNDDCEYVRLSVFGNTFNQGWVLLPWRDLDTPQGDRLAGLHTLRLRVDTSGLKDKIDVIEVRTRHLCGGAKVDRIFITIPIL